MRQRSQQEVLDFNNCSSLMPVALRMGFADIWKTVIEVEADVERGNYTVIRSWEADLTEVKNRLHEFVNNWLTWATWRYERARARHEEEWLDIYEESPVPADDINDITWKVLGMRNALYDHAVEAAMGGDTATATAFVDMGGDCEGMLRELDKMCGGRGMYAQWCSERPTIRIQSLHMNNSTYIENQNVFH